MAKTDIQITWDSAANDIAASPDPLYTGTPTGTPATIKWDWAAPVTAVTVTIDQEDGQPYGGGKPQPTCTPTLVTWTDPDTAQDTYQYTASADVENVGAVTLDPRIINKSG